MIILQSIQAKVGQTNMGNPIQVVVRTVTPVEDRALMTFGWDYNTKPGGIYDEATGATKIRDTSSVLTGTVWKTQKSGGSTIQFAKYAYDHSITLASNANRSNVTGDNSGAYPDSLITNYAYGNKTTGDYTLTFTEIANGTYKLKYFLNIKPTLTGFLQNAIDQIITLHTTSDGDIILPMPTDKTWFADNFNKVIETEIVISDGTFSISATTPVGLEGGLRGFLQVVELIKLN